jgi:hypothetical protein
MEVIVEKSIMNSFGLISLFTLNLAFLLISTLNVKRI